jgi:hypothetical protein
MLTVLAVTIGYSQNKNAVISELKNDEVKIKLHRFIEFNDSDAKSGKKFLVADITLENISGKSVAMGTDYTMSITIKDSKGNEYRSGLKGAGIVSSYLIKNTNYVWYNFINSCYRKRNKHPIKRSLAWQTSSVPMLAFTRTIPKPHKALTL